MPSPTRGEGAITAAAIAERTTCSNAQLWEDAQLLAWQSHAVKEFILMPLPHAAGARLSGRT